MQGFISVHRKMMANPIWCDPYYLKLWIYCLFTASHKPYEQLVGSQMIKLERGQFVTGRFSLSDDLNRGMKPKQQLSDRTWWRYLEALESFQMLTIKSTNKFSVVTIDKYDFYQGVFNKSDQQLSTSCPPVVQQLSTNNNVNKGNKKEYTSEFEDFWNEYPRKKEKAKAFKCWQSRLKEDDPNTLIRCAKQYAEEVKRKGTEENYIKLPATFLGSSKPYEDYKEISTSKEEKPKSSIAKHYSNSTEEYRKKYGYGE